MKSFYITTPIYYVNDSPHIGHAYTTIACDAMARFMRLSGHEVKFLTGTDEHGQKVDKAAKSAGKDPQAFTDEVSLRFRDLVNSGGNLLNISNTDFIRTTEARHQQACAALWEQIKASGNLYLGKYSGWYAVRDEAFYQESELVEGKAPTGAEVEWTEEESYFFRLSAFQERLLKFYDKNPEFIAPESRFNEVYSFVKGGLKDLSVSRTSFKWGVPVPGDPKHVMYVWIDALTNYLTSAGFPDMDSAEYRKFWEEGEYSPVHVVGKDILRFHAVYWPAFLMAADLPLPKKIVAHGWWTIEGEKMSKSLGNVIAPVDLVRQYGLDQTRYFLLREVPFGNDGNFSRANLAQRVNAELANTIGNLAQRTLSMVQKNCGGAVPAFAPEEADRALLARAYGAADAVSSAMMRFEYSVALEAIVMLAKTGNEYIDAQAPWKLKKENPARMETVLYTLMEVIRVTGILLQPFTPASAGKMLDQLAVPAGRRMLLHVSAEYALQQGLALPAPEIIFPRCEEANHEAA